MGSRYNEVWQDAIKCMSQLDSQSEEEDKVDGGGRRRFVYVNYMHKFYTAGETLEEQPSTTPFK